MSLSEGVAGSTWTNLYSRAVGGIQLLYASFFGWFAFLCLRWAVEQMIQIARNDFSFQGRTSKDVYFPALDLKNLAEGTVLALLSLCCMVGGYGLLRLRWWVRRWEIAYLIVSAVFSLWVLANEIRMCRDIGGVVLFSMAFTLPYLPVLLISPLPQKAPLFGKTKGAKPVFDDLDGI